MFSTVGNYTSTTTQKTVSRPHIFIVNRMDSEASTRVLVLHVYRSVWEEYSEWSNNTGSSTLKSLEAKQQLQLDLAILEETAVEIVTDGDFPQFTVSEFDGDVTTDEYSIRGRILYVDQNFRRHPPYECCTPLSRNLMVGDDPDDLPFIPFADDPAYNFHLDVEEHSYFRWNQPNLDPDGTCHFPTDFLF